MGKTTQSLVSNVIEESFKGAATGKYEGPGSNKKIYIVDSARPPK